MLPALFGPRTQEAVAEEGIDSSRECQQTGKYAVTLGDITAGSLGSCVQQTRSKTTDVVDAIFPSLWSSSKGDL